MGFKSGGNNVGVEWEIAPTKLSRKSSSGSNPIQATMDPGFFELADTQSLWPGPAQFDGSTGVFFVSSADEEMFTASLPPVSELSCELGQMQPIDNAPG